jgi:hypothetical protein
MVTSADFRQVALCWRRMRLARGILPVIPPRAGKWYGFEKLGDAIDALTPDGRLQDQVGEAWRRMCSLRRNDFPEGELRDLFSSIKDRASSLPNRIAGDREAFDIAARIIRLNDVLRGHLGVCSGFKGATAKLMASVAFSGDLNPDPESAAAALRASGYEVFLLPDGHPLLAHLLDDFIEVVIASAADDKIVRAIMDEINGIVDPCGGLCLECGPISSDYVPFLELFKDALPAVPDEMVQRS